MKTPHSKPQAQTQPTKSKRGRKPEPTGIDAVLDEVTRNKVLAIAASNAESPDDTLKRMLVAAVAEAESPAKVAMTVTFQMSRAAVEVVKWIRARHWHDNPDAIEFALVAQVLMEIALTDPRWLSKRFFEAARYRDAEGVCILDYFAREGKDELAICRAELDAEDREAAEE